MPDDQSPAADARLAKLAEYDTPTICNALEVCRPERRTFGFTTKTLICPYPDLPPMVGYARTATICASRPPADPKKVPQQRLDYYKYVAAGRGPTVSVIQDLDDPAGIGSFWGEVHTAVHTALGCQGVVTNGAIRDLDANAPGFRMLSGTVVPSHVWVHLVGWGDEVNVHGMVVQHDDLIHADRHGAVIIPHDAIDETIAAAGLCERKEAPVLAVARGEGFTVDKLAEAMGQAAEIH